MRATSNYLNRGASGLHAAVVVWCLGAVVMTSACSDDDPVSQSAETGSDGSANSETSSTDSAQQETSAPDTTIADSVPANAPDGDASLGETLPLDSTPSDVVPVQDSAAEVAVSDAADVAETAPAIGAGICQQLDSDWAITTDKPECTTSSGPTCPDRASTWANDIMTAFANGPLGSDCRISSMLAAEVDVSQYANDLIAWTLAFAGCPDPTVNSTPLKFGLIPGELSTHVFTSADLKLLSDFYVQAIDQALVEPSSGTGPLPALTSAQKSAVVAQLAALAASMPGVQASAAYSFDSCPVDVPTDGGND